MILLIIISFFLVKYKEEKYYCYSIGVDNDYICFYLLCDEDENNVIKKYDFKGNDYSKAIECFEKDGYEIDFNILNSIYFSKNLCKENEYAFIENYKDFFSLKTPVFKCNLNILLLEDVMNNQGVYIIPEAFGKQNNSAIFLDVIYKRKRPLIIDYSGDKFVDQRYE